MSALVIYDISENSAAVKEAMLRLGYVDLRAKGEKLYCLPSGTLWNPQALPSMALADIRRVAQQLGVNLERAISVAGEPWEAIPGQPTIQK